MFRSTMSEGRSGPTSQNRVLRRRRSARRWGMSRRNLLGPTSTSTSSPRGRLSRRHWGSLVVPRKRWKYKVTSYDVPRVGPADRQANTDEEIVRHALVDFEELDVLTDATRKQLIGDLVD